MSIKVLITGKNSYLSRKLFYWLEKDNEIFKVESISLKNIEITNIDFQKYDVVCHVANITPNLGKHKKKLYYDINTLLSYEVALQSKIKGVKHFIYISSLSVYGKIYGRIDSNTKPNPISFYGKSKFLAEKHIQQLVSSDFGVSIVRAPTIYGPQCNGSYYILSKFIKKYRVFPKRKILKSMIYIDNLTEFVKQIILNSEYGTLFPQNDEIASVVDLTKLIGVLNNKKIHFSKIISILSYCIFLEKNKAMFRSVFVDLKMSEYIFNYRIVSFFESIKLTEEVENVKNG